MENSNDSQNALPMQNNTIIKIQLSGSDENDINSYNLNGRSKRFKKHRKIDEDADTSHERDSSIPHYKKPKVKLISHKLSSKNPLTKHKSIQKLFKQFKAFPLYSDYPLFNQIEKKIKANCYCHYTEIASDIRNTFSSYFLLHSFSSENYCQTMTLCNDFELLYKEYDNKQFMKQSRNLIELKKKLNKVKKEIRETNSFLNPSGMMYSNTNANQGSNKMKCSYNDNNTGANNDLINEKISNRKYKMSLIKKIRQLNQEQKKGIASIVSQSFLDINGNMMELDVNKIPSNQLRELEKYVCHCLQTNSSSGIQMTNEQINLNININNTFLLKKSHRIHDQGTIEGMFSDEGSISSDESDSECY